MPRAPRPCPVPGCERFLSDDNRKSLVCEVHRHADGYCQCLRCTTPPKPKPLPVWNAPAVVRPSASAVHRGCRTTVTADTAEAAEHFLARMTARLAHA